MPAGADFRPTRRTVIGATAAGAAALAAPAAAASLDEPPPPLAPGSTRLWYRRPAREWTQALPVGNGRLGAMVFGGIASERLALNVDDLWAGGPYDPVNPAARAALPTVRSLIAKSSFAEAQALAQAQLMAVPIRQMPYQSVGSLMVTMTGGDGVDGYRRQLDLDTGIASTTFASEGRQLSREVLASAADGVIALRISGSRPGGVSASVRFAPDQDGAFVPGRRADELEWVGCNQARDGIAGRLGLEVLVRVLTESGRVARAGEALEVVDADAVTILIAIATSHTGWDAPVVDPVIGNAALIDRASTLGWTRLRAAHVADHRRLFRRVSLDLGSTPAASLPTDERIARSAPEDDPALAALHFHYARYLLAACSRPGTQPANLQGLWNDSNDPPWGSKLTININTEMNYWPAEAGNLADCVEPLVRMVEDLARTGARTARAMYGARGWVAHHNTDLWRATAPIDGAQYGLWPTGGAWLCRHLWDHWDYGRDLAYLQRIWPVLRDAALFFVDTLQVDDVSGWLVTSPSLSPENEHRPGVALCAGPTMDMQILRDLFGQCLATIELLGRDRSLAELFAAARARLAPSRIGRSGLLMEWLEDWDDTAPDPHHRHVSHLYGLYPSQQIDRETTPDLAAAARRSLERRGDEATGWGIGWRIALWARLGDGGHAHALLMQLLRPERSYPNLFDAHPPFQIDGNFGGAAGVLEMLVRDRGGTVVLLPALPPAWQTGSVRGIRLRGGAEADLEWHDGIVTRLNVRARVAGRWLVSHGSVSRGLTLPAGGETLLTSKDLR